MGLCLILLASGCQRNTDHTSETIAATPQPSNTETPKQSEQKSLIRFTDVTESAGVHFVPRNGREAARFTILESLGTGVGVMDIDADGHSDLVFAGGGSFDSDGQPIGNPSGVFRKQTTLRFLDVTEESQLRTEYYSHGVIVADWDDDGFTDTLVTGYHDIRLFRNLGDGTFEDVTHRADLIRSKWSTGAAFLDADGDLDLDLFVVNYVDWQSEDARVCHVEGHRDICPPREFSAQTDLFYLNDGDGTFTEAATRSGLIRSGKGLATIAADIDLDGDTDLYVANDTTANFLYLNDGEGSFSESGLGSGCALGATAMPEGSMGVDVADFDSDGLPDIWVSNYENQSFAMYQSRGPGVFQHVSSITGISAVGQLYVGFGTVGFDAELDGDLDIFAANGHVMYSTGKAPVRQKPLLYENLGANRFRNVAEESGAYGGKSHMARGVVAHDFDFDGLKELVVTHMNENVAILRNDSIAQGRPFRLRLTGRTANRSGIGHHATILGTSAVQLTKSGGSYLSSSPPELSGKARERLFRVELRHSGQESYVDFEHPVSELIWRESFESVEMIR